MEDFDQQTQTSCSCAVKQTPTQSSNKKERKVLAYEEMTEKKSSNQKMVAEMGQKDEKVEKNLQDQVLEYCLRIFPYPEPYQVQIESIKSIIKSLCEKQNLLFQSPTGTGKTLVSICAALAYAEKNPGTQVLILTRTNEQINGFIKEIRKIKNYPDINRFAILAGRGQFCLYLKQFKEQYEKQKLQQSKFNKHLTEYCNSKVSKKKRRKLQQNNGEQQNEQQGACSHDDLSCPKMEYFGGNQSLDIGARAFYDQEQKDGCACCPHYKIYKKMVKEMTKKESLIAPIRMPEVRRNFDQPFVLPDIEDMRDVFEQRKLGCPFFFNKLAAQSAKIIFSTYNYVIKQNILGTIKDLFKGEVIVVFDEAHNISDQAEQEQAIKLSPKHWEQLNLTLKQMQKVFSKTHHINTHFTTARNSIKDLIKRDILLESNFFTEKLRKKIEEGDSTDSGSDNGESDKEDGLSDDEDNDIDKGIQKYKHAKYQKIVVKDSQKASKKRFFKSMDTVSDVYDKIYKKMFEEKDIPINSSENLKRISEYIDKVKQQSVLTVTEMEDVFSVYQDERLKEVFTFLDNIQSEFLSINEECEGISYLFDERNQKHVKPFCSLFSDKDMVQHFEKLNVTDTRQAQQFIDRLIRVYNLLSYVKKVIDNNTKEEDPSKSNDKKPNEKISVLENQGEMYEVDRNQVPMLKKVSDEIKLKYFNKVWNFYNKMLKLRKKYVFQEDDTYIQNHYLSLSRNDNQQQVLPQLEIGCLSASYLFQKIQKKLNISSLILTSGTLEPFELIEKCLGLPFQRYSSNHIIDSKANLFTHFITTFNNEEISFSKKAMDDEERRDVILHNSQLAINTILSIFNDYTKQINQKSGIVIFFKSYQMLNYYYNTVGHILSKDCNIYKESRDANEFKNMYQDYKNKIQENKNNCIFLAVNRGKLSEGIDLKDELCRVVILYGVPYPHLFDPYIMCKRKHAQLYLGENNWYKKETVKVVNQAAGRCIRYKDDWGCIFFLDEQYQSESNIYSHISKWILEGQKCKRKTKDEAWINQLKEFLQKKCEDFMEKKS